MLGKKSSDYKKKILLDNQKRYQEKTANKTPSVVSCVACAKQLDLIDRRKKTCSASCVKKLHQQKVKLRYEKNKKTTKKS